MDETPSNSTRAGGVFLLAGIVIGMIAGILLGQPTIGMLAGTGVGLALLAALWLLDRRRG